MQVQVPASLHRSRNRKLVLVLAAAAAAAGRFTALSGFDTTAPDLRPRRRALTPATKVMRALMPFREVLHYSHEAEEAGGAPRSPPDWDRWHEDIDYEQAGLCGKRKCFFLSAADPSHGYLIEGHDPDRPDETVRAYEYARTLEAEHGVRHFGVAPPFKAERPPSFEDRLGGDYREFYEGAERLIVQPSRTAPEGSIVMRCYNDSVLFGRLHYILGGMDLESKVNLAEELEGTIGIVGEHPELAPDFQLMIDPRGQIYHLDFDRVKLASWHWLRYNKLPPVEDCLEKALEYVKHKIAKDEKINAAAARRRLPWQGLRCRDRPHCHRRRYHQ